MLASHDTVMELEANTHPLDLSLATTLMGAGAMIGMAITEARGAAALPHHIWPALLDPALGPVGGIAGALLGLVAYLALWLVRRTLR